MTSRSSCAAFSFTLSLILWHCVLISAEDTTAPLPASTLLPHSNQQATVGWVNNPKRRGTLTIIIDCLTTIFACTWTVLHLNIPAIEDSPTTRILRKLKWMAIAIVFPQIIFVKAVCELRFALFTLHMMYRSVKESPEKFETEPTKVYGNGRLVSVTQIWTVEFGLLKIWLYKLLLRQWPSVESTAKSTHPEEWYYLPGPFFASKQVQKWTLTHAYYVNMGGIVAQKQNLGVRETPKGEALQPVIDYSVVRGDHFADADLEAWSSGHPLQQLRLSVKDIKDKSKADWIVKTIAIIQIGRLILDLITRTWSFRFPTRVEQLAWQAAALVSTILPMIAWAGLFLPYLYRSPGLKRKLAEAVAEKVDSFGPELLNADDDWWNTFTTALRGLLRDLWRSQQQGRSGEQERIISTIWDIENDLKVSGSTTYALRDQYETWIKGQDAFLYGTLPEDPELSAPYKAWYYFRYREPASDPGLFRWIFLRCEIDMGTSGAQYRKKWRNFYILVQSFNMVAAILYTAARLIILAIMFSSLRAAPDGVYDTPDWTRFMPSFS
ncbi:hypothetical protein NEUTE1DRAFT_41272 [Neurospora tetrasperma FGSC 2508]|uniref:Uncharacterized protein n=1 Tax=Neurospora tetrasperma (strain FGSC 2508 / ATCC MYA-4615 / P0657) TaxID=510951 RepID=F8MLN6_NEUT8|nr:uncharacterized protein NEUTE1DRAFT_41272 [Neurospora tetrasperma FGSC 2508]EGO58455.1 hypothetical protein NEUTE1DRAFT_41272 [Neurospora tetrasperma FGSC 2508]EGZ71211.1 hypothetical protein NEUTE2DRAFT_128608 [Neurospora tetrasperma FGSC 2509]